MIKKVFYGPPEWIVAKFSQRTRLALAFWIFITAAILSPILGNFVWYVTILSVLALMANVSAETPVKEEK